MTDNNHLVVSPLAPEQFPDIPDIGGMWVATGGTGMKYLDRDDVLLASFLPGTTVAGVFTQSLTASAPIDWCQKALKSGAGGAQALIVNAGNANAFTGEQGVEALMRIVEATADVVSCRPSRVFAASTGVIGEELPDEMIRELLPTLSENLNVGGMEAAARAIMTTDTYPKGSHRTATIGGVEVNIAGIAKGSGMIAPNMATMLSFIFTDAGLPADVLQICLSDVVSHTFNCVTIDSDTSTNDTLMLFATGAVGKKTAITGAEDPILSDFRASLKDVCADLAQQIAKDGEGASKFITVRVTGAENNDSARTIGLSIANSMLVKTAIAGGDANWGRIVMAVGKAGQRADRDKLKIDIGNTTVADKGCAMKDYNESQVAEHMNGQEIILSVDVGIADGSATIWSCDLTQNYISINADYRS